MVVKSVRIVDNYRSFAGIPFLVPGFHGGEDNDDHHDDDPNTHEHDDEDVHGLQSARLW